MSHLAMLGGFLIALLLVPSLGIASESHPPSEPNEDALLMRVLNGGVDEHLDACAKLIQKGDSPIKKMIRLLRHKKLRARRMSVQCLARVPSPSDELILAVEGTLADEDERVRSWGAEALGFYAPKSKATIPSLVGLIQDPVRHVRMRAVLALAKFGDEGKSELQNAKVSKYPETMALIKTVLEQTKDGKQ